MLVAMDRVSASCRSIGTRPGEFPRDTKSLFQGLSTLMHVQKKPYSRSASGSTPVQMASFNYPRPECIPCIGPQGASSKSNMSLPVSVLDLVGMRHGENAGAAIARSVDLAQHVEKWGYRRFWLAEHHSIDGLACSATALLIERVAASTGTIRVGSGGVMLPNHAPLVIAEQFGTLEAMHPGRIDLGLGRAPGGDFLTMRALRRDLRQTGDDFPELLEELRTYLGPERAGQAVKAIPGKGSNVPITLLGSSDFSARLAASLGLPFAFAAHFAPDLLEAASRIYRENFRPSETLQQPWLMIGVQIIAAESDAAARRLFTTSQQRFLRLIRNQPVELLPPVDSMDEVWSDWERPLVENKLRAAIVGSESTVEAGIEQLVAATGADEIIVVTDTWEHDARLESYRRLAAIAARVGMQNSALAAGEAT